MSKIIRDNIVVIHRKKEGYFPVDYLNEYEVGLEDDLPKGSTIVKTGTLFTPRSMENISDAEIAGFLNSAIHSGFVFADYRGALNKLAEESCWIRLEGLVSKNVLSILNKNISFAKNVKVDDDSFHENHCDEIFLLGELASFYREQIEAIPGIGRKTMKKFDTLIRKNRLHWAFPMHHIALLGEYH